MNKNEYNILRLFKNKGFPMTLTEVSILLDKVSFDIAPVVVELHSSKYLIAVGGYIPHDGSIAEDTKLKVSYAGEKAMEEFRSINRNLFWTEFRAWFTLLIALAAFIKSFFF